MKLNKHFIVTAVVLVLTALTLTTASALPTFTGNAPADFTEADFVVTEPVPDVGVPPGSPPGTISGWDVAAIYFDYESFEDVMYVGIDCHGICGDAEGDGDPDSDGGDLPNLSGTESFALAIDTDKDRVLFPPPGSGDFEVVVGVASGSDSTSFGTYAYVGSQYSPQTAFGTLLSNVTTLFANPSSGAPDIEFSIADFSTLPDFNFTPGDAFEFQVFLYAGSREDQPVGEDYVFGIVTYEPCGLKVVKTCQTGDLTCQSAIAATTLRYTGPDIADATVVFEGKKHGSATYSNVNLVSGVTVLTDPGQNDWTIDGSPMLGSKTTIVVTDNDTGDTYEEIIHTSCSALYEAGAPAPLDGNTPNPPGSSKGDPSPTWFVESFIDKDGNVVEAPSSSCVIVRGDDDDCGCCDDDCCGGDDCDGGDDDCCGDDDCDGGDDDCCGGDDCDDGDHDCCGDGDCDDGDHDCDDGDDDCDGSEVIYEYTVTNIGTDTASNISIFDDKLGSINGLFSLGVGESRSFTATTTISETTTNIATVMGTINSEICIARASATVDVLESPPSECDVTGDCLLKIKDDEIEWKLSNGGDTVTIDSITIEWPADLGNLKKVKLGEKTIFDQERSPISTTIDSGWKGKTKDRQIKAGKDGKLKFEFKDKAGTSQGDYAITVNFAEGCSVEFTPGDCPFQCNKPIDELTMIWNGTGNIHVRAWKGSVGSTLLADIDGVSPSDEVTVGGFAGSPNDVYWEIFEEGTLAKMGESTFHLSCSDPDMNGPEDCGKPEGDGKGKSGYIHDWLLEGMVDSVSTLDCTP